MLEVLYYLHLAKEIALILLNVVVLVLASVFMVMGLFTCLRSLKRRKVRTFQDRLVEDLKDPEFKRAFLLETARQAIRERAKIKVKPTKLLCFPKDLEDAKKILKAEFKDASTGKEEKWIKKTVWNRDEMSGKWALKTIWIREDSA